MGQFSNTVKCAGLLFRAPERLPVGVAEVVHEVVLVDDGAPAGPSPRSRASGCARDRAGRSRRAEGRSARGRARSARRMIWSGSSSAWISSKAASSEASLPRADRSTTFGTGAVGPRMIGQSTRRRRVTVSRSLIFPRTFTAHQKRPAPPQMREGTPKMRYLRNKSSTSANRGRSGSMSSLMGMSEPRPSKAWTFKLGGELADPSPGVWRHAPRPGRASGASPRSGGGAPHAAGGRASWGSTSSTPPTPTAPMSPSASSGRRCTRTATCASPPRRGWRAPVPTAGSPLGRPEYLIQQAHKSLRQLGVDRIDLWQLHRIDPKVPRDEQFGAVKSLLDAGSSATPGSARSTVEEIEAASQSSRWRRCRTATTWSSAAARRCSTHCERHGIGFIPWFPLGAGALTQPSATIDKIAKRHGGRQPDRAGLDAAQSPVMLPISGDVSRVDHLEENVAAARIVLAPADAVEMRPPSTTCPSPRPPEPGARTR